MSRPMSRDETARLQAHLHGRRFELFIMAEKWVRQLQVYLPIAWEQVRQDRIENMALIEMQRRESQLPVHCLCEETYVLETIWRLVSNDEYRHETDARRQRLEESMVATQAQLAAHIEAQITVQDRFDAQLGQLTRRLQDPSHLDPAQVEGLNALQNHLEAQLARLAQRGEDPSPLQAEP